MVSIRYEKNRVTFKILRWTALNAVHELNRWIIDPFRVHSEAKIVCLFASTALIVWGCGPMSHAWCHGPWHAISYLLLNQMTRKKLLYWPTTLWQYCTYCGTVPAFSQWKWQWSCKEWMMKINWKLWDLSFYEVSNSSNQSMMQCKCWVTQNLGQLNTWMPYPT